MKLIGNKSIKLTFWNGNIELKKEKLEINKDNQKEHLLLKNKNKEKKNNNLKSISKRLSYAIS